MSNDNKPLSDEEITHITWPSVLDAADETLADETRVLSSSTTLHDPDATAIATATPDMSWGEVVFPEDDDLSTVVPGPADTALEFPEAAPVALKEGSVVNNRFVIDQLLGIGGMGVVYRALDRRKQEAQDRDPYVAIKILGDRFRKYPKAFVALQREARKSQSLAHPNVITVYDFDRDGDLVYMTMEQLAGSPMDSLIKANPQGIPPARAAKIITGIAQGLAYAHSKGIVHSDLKPGNVFVLPDDSVKILDFGIARAVTGATGDGADHTVFDAGEIGGLTPAYASLEMFQGAAPHPSDDVYALGVMAYELYSGGHPYGRKSANVAAETGLKFKPLKGVSRPQWRAVANALALPREKRLTDAQAFLKQFGGWSKGVRWLGVALAASLVALVAALTLVTPEPGPEVPFEALPVATQNQITTTLGQADEALAFGDVDGALYLLDEANGLHPGNLAVAERVDRVAAAVLDTLAAGEFTAEARLQRINTLLGYTALASNTRLLAAREKLAAGQ